MIVRQPAFKGRLVEKKDKYILGPICNICGKYPCETVLKRLVRDHCHKTGFIRGTLCDDCNVKLGFFESQKHDASKIIEERDKVEYITWVTTYREKIFAHLATNTGIKYIKFYVKKTRNSSREARG